MARSCSPSGEVLQVSAACVAHGHMWTAARACILSNGPCAGLQFVWIRRAPSRGQTSSWMCKLLCRCSAAAACSAWQNVVVLRKAYGRSLGQPGIWLAATLLGRSPSATAHPAMPLGRGSAVSSPHAGGNLCLRALVAQAGARTCRLQEKCYVHLHLVCLCPAAVALRGAAQEIEYLA